MADNGRISWPVTDVHEVEAADFVEAHNKTYHLKKAYKAALTYFRATTVKPTIGEMH
jgi:hypothetical protein